MNKKYIIWGAVGFVLLLLLTGGCSAYNSLVELDAEVESSWGEVQVQYQRRLDLIPNLVSTVKGYAAHESTTFQNVTEARAGLSKAYAETESLRPDGQSDARNLQKYDASQQQLQRALDIYVNAVHEAYPQLQASEQFLSLQDELANTENKISTERHRYINAVKEYNVAVKRFPKNIMASLFGYDVKPQYAAEEQAQHAPKVEF